MPVRTTVSALEAAIIPQVRSYLKSRSNELARTKADDPERAVNDGIDMLTDAIALGINEAFKGPLMHSLVAPIIDTLIAGAVPPIIPIGTTIITPLLDAGTTPVTPNPLLNKLT